MKKRVIKKMKKKSGKSDEDEPSGKKSKKGFRLSFSFGDILSFPGAGSFINPSFLRRPGKGNSNNGEEHIESLESEVLDEDIVEQINDTLNKSTGYSNASSPYEPEEKKVDYVQQGYSDGDSYDLGIGEGLLSLWKQVGGIVRDSAKRMFVFSVFENLKGFKKDKYYKDEELKLIHDMDGKYAASLPSVYNEGYSPKDSSDYAMAA